jgi:nitroreductase
MDVMDAIQKRRSIRHFKPIEIPDNVLEKLLNAMRLAPSGGNCQPRKFIVVRDKLIKSKVAAACAYRIANGRQVLQDWIAEAPVVIIGCSVDHESAVGYYKDGEVIITYRSALDAEVQGPATGLYSTVETDLAIALDHLTLAATAEGLGSCWIGAINEPKLKEILGIPANIHARLAIVIGYPYEWPDPRPRKALDQIVCYDTYSV